MEFRYRPSSAFQLAHLSRLSTTLTEVIIGVSSPCIGSDSIMIRETKRWKRLWSVAEFVQISKHQIENCIFSCRLLYNLLRTKVALYRLDIKAIATIKAQLGNLDSAKENDLYK